MRGLRATVRDHGLSAALRIFLAMMIAAALVPPMAGGQEPKLVTGGTVTDAVSADPIAGASVWVEYHDTSMDAWYDVGTSSTGPDGTYAVYDEFAYGAGEYSVSVAADGYVNAVQERDWDGVSALEVDFALTVAEPIASGTVSDAATGARIGNVQITAEFYDSATLSWQPKSCTYTAPDGTYTVYDEGACGAGRYRFFAGAAGYLPKCSDEYTWDGTTPLAVDDIALGHPLLIATGAVTDAETEDRIAGAFITVEFYDPDAEEWDAAYYATSAADGTYSLSDQYEYGAGQYRFNVGASGYVHREQLGYWNGADPLTVDFALEPAPPLATGTVTDAVSTDPVDGASVQAEYRDPSNGLWCYAGQATTDSDGTYVLDSGYNYGAGDYRFTASASGYGDQSQELAWDGTGSLTVDFALTDPGEPPAAAADTYSVEKDHPLDIAAPGVLANDTDADGDDLSAGIVESVAHGTLLLISDGSFSYTPAAGWSGTDHFTYRASDGGLFSNPALVTISVEEPPPPVPTEVTYLQIGGDDRFGTAVLASKDAFPTPGTAGAVVVATGMNWPDALGAAALAGAYDAPVLLTKTGELPPDVAGEIKRLAVPKAFIIGSDKAVSSGVESALARLVGGAKNVTRLSGPDRYATASAVAGEVKSRMTALGEWDGRVFIATGRNFPDALAASPLAAAEGIPILLVSDTLPSVVAKRLRSLQPEKLVLLGSSGVVSANVDKALREYAPTSRIWGDDRYGTAVRIADYSAAEGLGWDGVAVATGQNFPDALAGGAAQGLNDSLVLLTPTDSLNQLARNALAAHKNEIHTVRFLGKTSAVSDRVRRAVKAALD